ncbi:carotenoid cleavage dioxygenase 7, chloroplastic [Ananas comosus]|uniref:Carotenoid cleavage dioxygenase 7, chloroplastic n=1 Tax=Ananas comosus TaxID=4615 RepID=A0A6P5ET62_ANACO|nr:carotenoid cleavage dioxygenase 7, chloroplastic [Ananas comosus]
MDSLPHHHLLPLPPPPRPPKTYPKHLPSSSASAVASPSSLRVTSAASTTISPTVPTTTTITDSPATAFWDYNLLFASQRCESPDPIPLRLAEGSLPADFPAGTYYLAGPGLFSDDHGSTVHPLDGHGYLRAFDFRVGGGVYYSARYVATMAQREERRGAGSAWRFTHRGPFSVLRGGKRVGNVKVMKNVANTSVLRWSGRVLCLWEGGDPYEVDPRTLETVGAVDSDGRGRCWWPGVGLDVAAHLLKPILGGVFNMPQKRLLAHYKIDPKRNRLLLLSCNAEDMLLPRSHFTFYEFDCNFELKQKKEFVIPDQLMIHDWAFTDSHYILIGNRIKVDVPGSLLAVSGLHPMISALSVNPSQPSTPIYVLPRFSAGETNITKRDWRVPVEAPSQLWGMHIGNAFEERDGDGNLEVQLQVSVCSYQWFNFQRMFGYNWRSGKLDPSFMNVAEGKEKLLPHLIKMKIDIDSSGNIRCCSITDLSEQWNRPADFPAINPDFSNRKNTFVYAAATSGSRRFLPHFPFDSVVKLNTSDGSVSTWSTTSRSFIGEPIFIQRGVKEDDGYVLVVEYAVSERICYLVVLDAKRIGRANAVVAKLEVPKNLTFPLGFHGFWASR